MENEKELENHIKKKKDFGNINLKGTFKRKFKSHFTIGTSKEL